MAVSEARLQANRKNAQHSTGPKTVEGKSISRANSFKHGLTGAGIVLPNEDVAEVERRLWAFQSQLEPECEVGVALVRRAAVLSVRMERCVSQETAALSERVRQAEADFVAPAGADVALVVQLLAEAKARAMFDASKDAGLARKYEAAAERGFYRALKELRELKKQAKVAEPKPNTEELQEILASLSLLSAECGSVEAPRRNSDVKTPSMPAARVVSAPISPFDGPVDVPFTIGRPR